MYCPLDSLALCVVSSVKVTRLVPDLASGFMQLWGKGDAREGDLSLQVLCN